MIPGRWEWVDTPRLIPVDRVAEESLAGAAVVDGTVARLVREDMNEMFFHDGRCWQVIEAAADVDLDVNDSDLDWSHPGADFLLLPHRCANRGERIAHVTGIQISWLRQLVNGRSAERPDLLMARLVEVAEARRRNRALVDRLTDADVDVRMLTNFDAWMDQSRHAVLQACLAVGDALFRGGTDAAVAAALLELGGQFGLDAEEVTRATLGEDEP